MKKHRKVRNLERILVLAYFVVSVVCVFADRGDFGRYYSTEYGRHNSAWPNLIFWGVIICFFLVAILVRKISPRDDDDKVNPRNRENKPKYRTNNKVIYSANNVERQPCPKCKGYGYIRGERVSIDECKCPHCQGYGKVLTSEEISRLKNIPEDNMRAEKWEREDRKREEESEKEERRKKLQENELWLKQKKVELHDKLSKYKSNVDRVKIAMYFLSLSEVEYNEKLKELEDARDKLDKQYRASFENCPTCEHCNGEGKSCTYCGGFGKILTGQTETIRKQVRKASDKKWLFIEGYSIFNKNGNNRKLYEIQKEHIEKMYELYPMYRASSCLMDFHWKELNKFLSEIEKKNDCPYCNGWGFDVNSYVVDGQRRRWGDFLFPSYYRKKECDYPFGYHPYMHTGKSSGSLL